MSTPGTIRVIYTRGHRLASLLIRHHDDGAPRRWSHCGIEVGGLVWESRWPGGVGHTARHLFLGRYTEAAWVDYTVPDYGAAIARMQALYRTPYPVATVLGRLVGLHIDRPGVQCAELVETVLDAGGLRRWRGGRFYAVSPNASFFNLAGGVDYVPQLAEEMTE